MKWKDKILHELGARHTIRTTNWHTSWTSFKFAL